MSCWELRLLYYIVSKSSLTELNGACRLVLASLEPFFVVSLLVNYPLRVINRIGSSGWQGIAWWRSKCLWNVFSFSRSLFTSSGFMRSHDKVWNRWSSLDPTCPLISGAPPLTFFNNFFHLLQIRDTKPQWVRTSKKISHLLLGKLSLFSISSLNFVVIFNSKYATKYYFFNHLQFTNYGIFQCSQWTIGS